MPRQAPPWQGAQCEGRGCYKEGTETDQIFIQTQGSSDQILAVKTHLLLLQHFLPQCEWGCEGMGYVRPCTFCPQRPQPVSFAGLRPDGSSQFGKSDTHLLCEPIHSHRPIRQPSQTIQTSRICGQEQMFTQAVCISHEHIPQSYWV